MIVKWWLGLNILYFGVLALVVLIARLATR